MRLTPAPLASLPVAEAGTVALAMVAFALFAHRGFPLVLVSGAGLLATAVVIGNSLRNSSRPQELAGLTEPHRRLWAPALIGSLVALAAAQLHRLQPGALPPSPRGVHLWVVLACLIGASEELVYRGWMLGRVSALGAPAAVLIAATAHAAYKTALFGLPPGSVADEFSLRSIALWTTLGGIGLGVLRTKSESVLPAMVAHMVFDAAVYSGFPAPPWWVWG